jgi:nucleoside-diphosphate kinase
MAVERTFFLVKPSGVERGLVGEIIRRVETRGFVLRGLKMLQVSNELAEAHYEEHKDKPFFGELIDVITRGPVVAMVVEGESAIKVMRTMIGATNPADAAPGTIRGDFALEMSENIVHGSDAPESAAREIGLYFSDAELGLAAV